MRVALFILISVMLYGCSRDIILPFDTFLINSPDCPVTSCPDSICQKNDTCYIGTALYRIDPLTHDSVLWQCLYAYRTICDSTQVAFCDTAICNDQNGCTDDTCRNNACVYRLKQMDCNDNDPCTYDSPFWQCPDTVTCTHTPVPCDTIHPCDTLDCDDNDVCTIDTCFIDCSHWYIGCNDYTSCTADWCDSTTGCYYTPRCSDGDLCTKDSCRDTGPANVYCKYIPINCNDNNACTTDDCINGTCHNVPIDCNDGNPCTLDDCDMGNILNPCNYIDTCTHIVCDTVVDICESRVYCPGEPPFKILKDCSDGLLCTEDNCFMDICYNTPVVCDTDGDPCTDYCSEEWGGCVFNWSPCDDNNDCTNDFCDPITGECFNNFICGSKKDDPQSTTMPDGFYDLLLRRLAVPLHELPSGIYIQITEGKPRLKEIIRY